MIVPVERKLPGTPIPKDQLVADWEGLQHRSRMKGPVVSFLFDVHYSVPENIYQWRVQLDCGCARDVVTHQHSEKERADDVARLGDLADEYHFGIRRPSQREIQEAKESITREVVEDVKARYAGRESSVRPGRLSIYGRARLDAGQFLCQDPNCPKDRAFGGPVRDIVEWVRRRDDLHVQRPLEIDGETIGEVRECAVWDVILSCGHFDQRLTDPDWDPADGPVRKKTKNQRSLAEVLEVVADGDADEEEYWRRMYAEGHPQPAPFTRCRTCACARTVVAYERVGWLAPKKKSVATVQPKPVARRTLERRLQKLESQVSQVRQQLESLPDED